MPADTIHNNPGNEHHTQMREAYRCPFAELVACENKVINVNDQRSLYPSLALEFEDILPLEAAQFLTAIYMSYDASATGTARSIKFIMHEGGTESTNEFLQAHSLI